MALALVDGYFGKAAPAAPVVPKAASQQLKRQRSESSTSYESGQPIPALASFRTSFRQPSLRGFSRGGSRGSGPGSGNPFPRGSKRGSFSGDSGRGYRGK